MAKLTLSKRQKQIYQFIESAVTTVGFPPSIREIGVHVGLNSTSTVHAHLRTLQKAGLIRREHNKPRSMALISGGLTPVHQLLNDWMAIANAPADLVERTKYILEA